MSKRGNSDLYQQFSKVYFQYAAEGSKSEAQVRLNREWNAFKSNGKKVAEEKAKKRISELQTLVAKKCF